jgi:uncharacterized protein with von Willebrand factor type A (vWA) domain
VSSAFIPFVFELRARNVKVGTQEALALAQALSAGLHDSSLDGFYHVARALTVHREQDLDAFDQAFSAHFRGITLASLDLVKELEDWLKDPKGRRQLTDEERQLLESFDLEELRRRFEERMKEQDARHDKGNRWIGTGGTSAFGAHGAHPSGVRVGPAGGGRSALGVADARRYRGYRSDIVLDVRQLEVALRKLRAFRREGVPDELDLDETVARTSKNAGELEIVLRPHRKPRVRVLLLMDVGGSMDPHTEIVSRLFSAARRASNIRELKTYYFHNCVYGRVYATARFLEPILVRDILESTGPETKLIMVGDAAMHPGELLGAGDFDYYSRAREGEQLSGLRWMTLLAEHFRRSIWLNPDEPHYWRGGTAEALGKVFPMYPLTLDGLSEGIAHLSKGEPRRA